MNGGKTVENIKERNNLPEKNQWKLVKSNADTAESDNGSHSGVEKKSKNLAANKKYEDKTIQVNVKRLEKCVALDSSSNLSSNVSEKPQVKFREGPDKVYKDLATIPTDQDTSDLLCNYVVLRDECDPTCRQRTIENKGHISDAAEHFQIMTKTGLYHYYPHQESAKICKESNKMQITCETSNKNVPAGDASKYFGDAEKNNHELSENLSKINHRLKENEKKAKMNSETVAPLGRSIKRLKRIFGQEQFSTSPNYKKKDRSNLQNYVEASRKYNNMQSNRRGKCLYHGTPMKSGPTTADIYQTKIAAQSSGNIAKYTIFDGIHDSKRCNIGTPFLPEYNCKEFGRDMEFQSKPSYSINEPFVMNVPDDKGDIDLDKNVYRITNPLPERIEVYYFDHGSSSYFRTTDHPPPLATDLMIEKTDQMSTRLWAGIFGFLHIFFAVITSFFLQLYRFILISSVRPLLIGTFQVSSDYFLKPFLATLFNAIIQPFFILFYNVATSFRDLCEPIARGIGFFLEEFANILRAIRLVEVKNSTRNGPFLHPFRNQAIEI